MRQQMIRYSPSQNDHDIVKRKKTTDLLVDDLAVNFSSGDIVIAAQSDVEVALVITEIEVYLATVI